MAIRNFLLLTVVRLRNVSVTSTNRTILSNLNDRTSHYLAMADRRMFSVLSITKNIHLHSQVPVSVEKKENSIPKLALTEERPMVVLLEYLNAKLKHMKKFVDLYLDFGFDVLHISMTPWQVLWPMSGCQLIARDVAQFMVINKLYSPLVVHAFSVGGYLWGEVLVEFSKNPELYKSVGDRIKCRILDSPVDANEFSHAFPLTLFPKNPRLKSMLEACINFHLEKFYDQTMKHYKASRKEFTGSPFKTPTLLITSKVDLFSSVGTSETVKKELNDIGVECVVKVFEESQHVMHFKNHREEYVSEITQLFARHNVPVKNIKAKL